MFHLIREELMVQDDDTPLDGDVEMDEMYVGGRPRSADRVAWMGLPLSEKRSAAKKWANPKRTPVFGMVQRGGRVRAHVVPSTQEALGGHVHGRVLPEAVIYTDEAPAYVGIADKGDTSTAASTTRRVSDPSPGELDHLGRGVDGGNRIGVAKQLGRPRASPASELEDVTGGPERIEPCHNLIPACKR